MTTVHIVTNLETAQPHRLARTERRRLRMSTLARRSGLDPRREVLIAQRNGRWVYQRDWGHTLCGKHDVVVFAVMPKGSNTLRTVAQVAVIVLAAVVAGPVAGFLGIGGTVGTAAVGAALVLGGSYAVNALIPLPRPDAPGLGGSYGAIDANSPTYAFTLSSQQNLPRLGGAIPEWFGYHRVIPDLAATAWWEWTDGKQTLYQTLCLTKGEVEIAGIELGRTPVDVFEDVEYDVFEPNETADLFEAEVYQAHDISNIDLTASNELIAPDDGVRGPFAALPPGQTSTRFGLDITFPRGLYTQDGAAFSPKTIAWKVEARQIDDAGAPIGSWFTVANETFNSNPMATNTSTPESGITGTFVGGGYLTTNKMNSPLSLSYRYTFGTAMRAEFRVTRTDEKDLTIAAGHDLAWTGLRGFLGGGDYGDVTILQIAIVATASVNDRVARQIAVTGTRKLPTWDAEAEEWTAPQPTRSIAWAAAHVIRSSNGGRQPDENFDLAALLALHATWESRSDYFDYYASERRTLWEMLQTVLRCGRAMPYRQANLVRFNRDEPAAIPVTGFSRENIVQRTLQISYRTPEPEDDVDGFEVKYFDNRTWNFNSLRKAFAGTDPPERPQSRTLDGCTSVAQAQRELDYYVAEYNLRPISVRFDTEMEGMYPSRGDLILVAHDSPRWGQSNRVLTWDAETLTVEMFSPPVWDFAPDTGWFARFRDKRGRYSAQVVIDSAPTSTTLVLHNAPVYDGGGAFDFSLSNSELLHVMLGRSTDAPRPARFLEMIPRGQGHAVTVRAVLEDAAVHVN